MTDDDLEALRSMLGGFRLPLRRLRAFTIGGVPRAKMRPRQNTKTGHMYVPKEERLAVKATREVLEGSWIPRDLGRLAVACVFVRPDHHRVDLDNLEKFLLDSANGILWRDDSQIVALAASIHVDRRQPRTAFAIASIP